MITAHPSFLASRTACISHSHFTQPCRADLNSLHRKLITTTMQHTTDLLPSSPQRPKHQTNRSITETSFPKLHRPHHPHIHRLNRDAKVKETQSAHPNLQSNGWDMLQSKSEGVTPEQSRNASRRTSVLGVPGEMDELPAFLRDEKKMVKEGELELEKERAVQRAT
jgi:hypothetical protein